jgi:hypothetical protein
MAIQCFARIGDSSILICMFPFNLVWDLQAIINA